MKDQKMNCRKRYPKAKNNRSLPKGFLDGKNLTIEISQENKKARDISYEL
jgi:hypothetical protein